MKPSTRLINLAQAITENNGEYQLKLENDAGVCYVSLWWRQATGFELQAEVEYFGRYYPAGYLYPAEQDMLSGPVVKLETFKIAKVSDALAEEGFTL